MKKINMVRSVDDVENPVTGKQSVAARLENRTADAFTEAERQGLMLAAKVRTAALLVILLWAIVDNPDTGLSYLFNLLEIASFAALGGLQFICAKKRFHIDVLKYVFVLVDCALLAFFLGSPDPFGDTPIPPAVAMNGSRASYFFILLMQAAFSLRPHLVIWCGFCIVIVRMGMLLWAVNQPNVFTNLDLAEQSAAAFLRARPDPNFIFLGFWATEVIVTLILAAGLAVVVKRSRNLVESRSIAERRRASLARYFSPNVVDHVGDSEHLLGDVREQQVAVLFADIVGFTKLCEDEPPASVIALLRDYHDRLGQAVFDNEGTLDKYIGDGLMATFGTPVPSPNDARNALQCAMDMIAALENWNAERVSAGEASLHVGIGLHYGTVIAGDIGNERRLEYSVIGDTVNIASRLERLTRSLNTSLVVSDSLIHAIAPNDGVGASLVEKLSEGGVQEVRGRESGVPVWTFEAAKNS